MISAAVWMDLEGSPAVRAAQLVRRRGARDAENLVRVRELARDLGGRALGAAG